MSKCKSSCQIFRYKRHSHAGTKGVALGPNLLTFTLEMTSAPRKRGPTVETYHLED